MLRSCVTDRPALSDLEARQSAALRAVLVAGVDHAAPLPPAGFNWLVAAVSQFFLSRGVPSAHSSVRTTLSPLVNRKVSAATLAWMCDYLVVNQAHAVSGTGLAPAMREDTPMVPVLAKFDDMVVDDEGRTFARAFVLEGRFYGRSVFCPADMQSPAVYRLIYYAGASGKRGTSVLPRDLIQLVVRVRAYNRDGILYAATGVKDKAVSRRNSLLVRARRTACEKGLLTICSLCKLGVSQCWRATKKEGCDGGISHMGSGEQDADASGGRDGDSHVSQPGPDYSSPDPDS